MEQRQFIETNINKLDMEINDIQIDQLVKFYHLLIEKNKVMNLTSITEFKDVVMKHFVDSVSIWNVNVFKNKCVVGTSVIDIGTGAGFPGIPIKILFPQLKIVLVDSLNKRVNFLNEVIEELNLSNIVAIHSRAEDLANKGDFREKFDFCVSRAVANLATLSEYCIPFVRTGGNFISYKSGNIKDEINDSKNAIKILGGKIEKSNIFTLPDTDIERSLVVIKKIKSTSKKFPRGQSKPSKEPLK